MNLQLVYQCSLSLSKNEKMFYEKKKKKKKWTRNKDQKSFQRRESNPGPPRYLLSHDN